MLRFFLLLRKCLGVRCETAYCRACADNVYEFPKRFKRELCLAPASLYSYINLDPSNSPGQRLRHLAKFVAVVASWGAESLRCFLETVLCPLCHYARRVGKTKGHPRLVRCERAVPKSWA